MLKKAYINDSVIYFFRRESELEDTLRVCAVTVQNVNTSKNKRNKLASAGKTACKNTQMEYTNCDIFCVINRRRFY